MNKIVIFLIITSVLISFPNFVFQDSFSAQIIPISISTDKSVYVMNETISIFIKNESDDKDAILNFIITDPNDVVFDDISCLLYERPSNDIIPPNSIVKITWNTKECTNDLVFGDWEIISFDTIDNQLSEFVSVVSFKIAENIDEAFPERKTLLGKNQIEFMNNPHEGTFRIEYDDKIFDSLYEIHNGKVSNLGIWAGGFEIQIDEPQKNLIVKIKLPRYVVPSSELCYYGTPGYLIDRKGGTVKEIEVIIPTSGKIPLSNSSFIEYVITFSGDPADIYITIDSPIIYTPRYPTCYNFLEWTKEDAKLWSENTISNTHFHSMIQLLIDEKIVFGPTILFEYPNEKFNKLVSPTIINIPDWLKIPSKWWNEGKISDDEFIDSLEFLIDSNLIKFENR